MCVHLLDLLHDLRRAFKVLWIWLALLHLFRTVRKPQVLPEADRSEKVAQSAKQASFRVTLLRASLLRERSHHLEMTFLWFPLFSGDTLDYFFGRKKISFGLGGPLPRTGGKEG
jgi:hypothetical protein